MLFFIKLLMVVLLPSTGNNDMTCWILSAVRNVSCTCMCRNIAYFNGAQKSSGGGVNEASHMWRYHHHRNQIPYTSRAASNCITRMDLTRHDAHLMAALDRLPLYEKFVLDGVLGYAGVHFSSEQLLYSGCALLPSCMAGVVADDRLAICHFLSIENVYAIKKSELHRHMINTAQIDFLLLLEVLFRNHGVLHSMAGDLENLHVSKSARHERTQAG